MYSKPPTCPQGKALPCGRGFTPIVTQPRSKRFVTRARSFSVSVRPPNSRRRSRFTARGIHATSNALRAALVADRPPQLPQDLFTRHLERKYWDRFSDLP